MHKELKMMLVLHTWFLNSTLKTSYLLSDFSENVTNLSSSCEPLIPLSAEPNKKNKEKVIQTEVIFPSVLSQVLVRFRLGSLWAKRTAREWANVQRSPTHSCLFLLAALAWLLAIPLITELARRLNPDKVVGKSLVALSAGLSKGNAPFVSVI